jgi:hypothetical protein
MLKTLLPTLTVESRLYLPVGKDYKGITKDLIAPRPQQAKA